MSEAFATSLIENARLNLQSFALATKNDYELVSHHNQICNKLKAVADGKIKRLMIFMPPRHGKTELVSVRFPPWVYGLNPRLRIISTSYGAELAQKNNRAVQRIMDLDIYSKIFPKTQLHQSNAGMGKPTFKRNAREFEIVGFGGTYRAAGVGGAITGTGADILVIDDPIKNQKEADSITYRDSIWDWYRSTAYSRLEKDGAIILVQTRWHEDDLAGRLLKEAKDDPEVDQWEVLSLEAVKETETKGDRREMGEPLWPNKYSKERLNAIKKTAGSRNWNALYQQRPSALEGSIFKNKWMQFYKEKPARFDIIIQSWDAAFSKSDTSDYVVGQVWGKVGASFYLLDQVRDRMDFPETKKMIKTLSGKWPAAFKKVIEKKANGAALVDDLKTEVIGLVGYTPTESKESRANSVAPLFEAGNVYLPDPSIAPWIHDYVTELTSFPNATHDDRVDATTQALIDLRENADWLSGMIKR